MKAAVQAQGSSFDRYISEVRRVWGDGKDPGLAFEVKPLLENLLRTTNPDEPWMAKLIADGKQSNELYRDPVLGFIQMGHNQKPGHRNTPHDHGPCWVLYGVYRGKMEITKYRRVDDRSVAGQASIETGEVHTLTPGVVYAYLAGDIHSTLAHEPSVVFRFLSYDLTKVERYRYNMEKRTVSVVDQG
jgi:predicted metal-dependent enzyme (double-stranded beta helix superfamily)